MSVSFTRKGYYQVFLDGEKVSRPNHSGNHTSENEAEETAAYHASLEGNHENTYLIKQPDIEMSFMLLSGGSAPTEPAPTQQAAPTNFAAPTKGSTSVALTWIDNAASETGYEIQYRLAGTGNYGNTSTAAANATSAVVTGLTPETAYDFRIRAAGATPSNYAVLLNQTTQAAPSGTPATNPWADNTPRMVSPNGTTYDIGPGNYGNAANTYLQPQNLAWENLNAGDVVNIHGGTYNATIKLSAIATAANPIIINGVVSNGVAPIFDGTNSTPSDQQTAEARQAWAQFSEGPQAAFVFGRLESDPLPHNPTGYIIQNLEFTNYKVGIPYTGVLGESKVMNVASGAIRAQGTDGGTGVRDVICRNLRIHDCGNGIFTNSTGADTTANGSNDDYVCKRWLLQNNHLYDCGAENSDKEHSFYVQCEDAVYEGNYIGKQRPNCGGSALKDRSSGCVIRYNTIVGNARTLDLVDTEGAFGYFARTAADLEKYDNAHVYGNVLVMDSSLPGGATPRNFVHWGGDTGVTDTTIQPNRSIARLGTCYFYNNTCISNDEAGANYFYRVFDISEPESNIEAWNNIFVAYGNTRLQWNAQTTGTIDLRGVNLAYTSSTGSDFSTGVTNNGTLLTGDPVITDPDNTDQYDRDYRPSAAGPAGGAAGSNPPASILSSNPNNATLTTGEYLNHYDTVTRADLTDLGGLTA